MKDIKVSVNWQCRVKLTEAGEQIYREYWAELIRSANVANVKAVQGMKTHVDDRIKDGVLHDHLWQIMRIFGKHILPGRIVPFETDIIIEVDEA